MCNICSVDLCSTSYIEGVLGTTNHKIVNCYGHIEGYSDRPVEVQADDC
jgi:hypothetical protein